MVKIFLGSFVIILITVSLTGCPTSQINKEAAWKNDILRTDKEFSKASNTMGMKKAFIEYMDEDGILLRPNHRPIIGANAIEYLTEQNDSTYTLTWEPSSAQVAASGDLGYSYGIYNLQLQDTTLHGTYVSVWKQKDGKWKFVLDTGNEGIDKK
ncbi:MAG: nuclear transport factor 2 family protein [Ginsengibacter sp.]